MRSEKQVDNRTVRPTSTRVNGRGKRTVHLVEQSHATGINVLPQQHATTVPGDARPVTMVSIKIATDKHRQACSKGTIQRSGDSTEGSSMVLGRAIADTEQHRTGTRQLHADEKNTGSSVVNVRGRATGDITADIEQTATTLARPALMVDDSSGRRKRDIAKKRRDGIGGSKLGLSEGNEKRMKEGVIEHLQLRLPLPASSAVAVPDYRTPGHSSDESRCLPLEDEEEEEEEEEENEIEEGDGEGDDTASTVDARRPPAAWRAGS
jgi:hypothetical protein